MVNASSHQRDYLFDNLKFVLISLVVFAHFIEPYIDQSLLIKSAFTGIYFFHIPLFVFISGYFSKSVNSQSIDNNLRNLLIPYLIFSAAWYLKDDIHAGNHPSLNVIVPPFHLWYLLSLFFWRLTLRVVYRFRHFFILSVVTALVIGCSPDIGQPLSLSRTLVFFPFFILGNLCTEASFKNIQRQKFWIPIGITAWLVCDYMLNVMYPETFAIVFGDSSYISAAGTKLMGLAERSIFLIVAVLSSLAVIALTPSRKLAISRIGAKTMPVYVFHAFFVPRFTRCFPVWNESVYKNAVILTFPFLLVWLLSLPFVDDFYNFITGLFQPLIKKEEPQV